MSFSASTTRKNSRPPTKSGGHSRSGMASIYKAKDLETKQTVAVKIPYMQLESDPN